MAHTFTGFMFGIFFSVEPFKDKKGSLRFLIPKSFKILQITNRETMQKSIPLCVLFEIKYFVYTLSFNNNMANKRKSLSCGGCK